MSTYYSSGKLLITGEYLIIDGAESICIPTKKGQSLTVQDTEDKIISWKSYDVDNCVWFECKLDAATLEIMSTSDQSKSDFLISILKEALLLNFDAKEKFNSGVDVETKLDFDTTWGLGSSSTLLCNISKWLEVDPFQLHFKTTNGSGYDIACGLSTTPLIYQIINQKPTYQQVDFDPIFKDHIYFIHLNKKQVSSKEIKIYNANKDPETIAKSAVAISSISKQLISCNTLSEFEKLLINHEQLTAQALGKQTIKELLFNDYSGGIIKSLGAWGGDFILVTTSKTTDLDYFKNKGYTTIINWNEMFI